LLQPKKVQENYFRLVRYVQVQFGNSKSSVSALWHCGKLWLLVLLYLSFLVICLNLVKELLGCWRDGFRRHRSLNVWNAIPLCLIWCASLL